MILIGILYIILYYTEVKRNIYKFIRSVILYLLFKFKKIKVILSWYYNSYIQIYNMINTIIWYKYKYIFIKDNIKKIFRCNIIYCFWLIYIHMNIFFNVTTVSMLIPNTTDKLLKMPKRGIFNVAANRIA